MRSFLRIYLFLALLSLSWVFLLPPFQGSDESIHFAQSKLWFYKVQQVFDPDLDPSAACAEDLFPFLRKHRVPALRFNPLSSYQAPLSEYPRHYQFLNDYGCTGLNQPLYSLPYLLNLPFLFVTAGAPLLVQFYVLRLISWLILLGTLWVAYRVGKLLFSNPFSQKSLPLVMGLQPLFVTTGTWISYESLLTLLFSVNLWACLSFILQKDFFACARRFIVTACIVALLALFTKAIGVFVPVLTLLALLFSPSFRPLKMGAFFLVALAIVNIINTHAFSFSEFFSYISVSPQVVLWQVFLIRPWIVFESFWGGWGFGWLDTYAPPFFILVFLGLTGMSLWGALRVAFGRVKAPAAEKRVVQYCLLSLLCFEGLAILYNLSYPPVGSLTDSGFVQGRYYFSLMIPIALVLIYGLGAWQKTSLEHAEKAPVKGLLLFLLIYHFVYLNLVLIPRFYL